MRALLCGVLPKTIVGSIDAVKAGEVDTLFRYQSGQTGDEVYRLENHVGGAVPARYLQRVADIAVGGEGEP